MSFYNDLPDKMSTQQLYKLFYTERDVNIRISLNNILEVYGSNTSFKTPQEFKLFLKAITKLDKIAKTKLKAKVAFVKYVEEYMEAHKEDYIKVGESIFNGDVIHKSDLTLKQFKYIILSQEFFIWMSITEKLLNDIGVLLSLTEFPKMTISKPEGGVYRLSNVKKNVAIALKLFEEASIKLMDGYLSIPNPQKYFAKISDIKVNGDNTDYLLGNKRDSFSFSSLWETIKSNAKGLGISFDILGRPVYTYTKPKTKPSFQKIKSNIAKLTVEAHGSDRDERINIERKVKLLYKEMK